MPKFDIFYIIAFGGTDVKKALVFFIIFYNVFIHLHAVVTMEPFMDPAGIPLALDVFLYEYY